MNLKPNLIGGVALSAMLAVSMAGGAQAKSHKRHRPTQANASEAALKAEVGDLKAEVQALESRLDAQAAAQQQAQSQQQAQIQTAQSQAQAAQTSAQAAQTQVASQQSQIETIPTQVETATRKAAPKPGWWNNTTVGGTFFGDFSYIRNANDGVNNAQTGTDYDIKRAYLIIDHKFNDVWSAEFVSDFTYDSATKATQLYIKKAYMQAKLSDALVFRAGGADTPWIPFVESLYGYRYVEKVLTDFNSFGTSADWGLNVNGALMDHHLGYSFSIVDGAGYKIPAIGNANRTDYLDVEGRVNATFDHFTVAVGGYDGKLGKAITGVPTFHTAERFDAVAAYTDSRVRVGVEYMWAKYYSDILQANPNLTNSAEAVSTFASFNFTPKWSVFGRYDWLKPKQDTAPTFVGNYFNVGIGYKPIAPLDIALVYKRESVTDGLLSNGNGTIGTLTNPPMGKGTYDEVGVFTQVKF